MKMPTNVPGPAYCIHTRRLVLRCWSPADAPLLKTAIDASLGHLRPWLRWTQHEPQNLEAKVKWLRRCRGDFDLGRDFVYGVFSRDETQVLGSISLNTRVGKGVREIGCWIHADHVNQGVGTEVTAALIKVAFEIEGVDRIEIHCDPNNKRGAAVPEKLGLVHEATLRQRAFTPDGKPRDDMIWTLFADKYPTSAAATAEIEAFDVIGRRIL